MFSLHSFTTMEDGTMITKVKLDDRIIADFTIEETAGDELYVQAGDLSLRHIQPIPRGQIITAETLRYWLAVVYGDDIDTDPILGVYSVPASGYDEYDHISGIYSSRLKSIQQIFYQDIADAGIYYEASDNADWNYGIEDSGVALVSVEILQSGVPESGTYRSGWSLGDMIANLAGKHGHRGYEISSVTLENVPQKNSNNLPIIFRGSGFDLDIWTKAQALDNTFKQDPSSGEDYGFRWKNLFEFLIFAFNSFVRITPDSAQINSGTLAVYLSTSTRAKLAALTSTTVSWISRKYIPEKYRIDGVKLSGANFEYTQGAIGNVVERSIDIADPEQNVTRTSFYWVAGDDNGAFHPASGLREYDATDGSGNMRGYFGDGLVEPYYINMITDGAGYEGEIRYDGQSILSWRRVKAGGDIIRLFKMVVNQDGIANIEGIVQTW